MTEISFARSFLSALDARPIKISSDHITDPRQLPTSVSYTIAKYPSSSNKRKRGADDASTSTPAAAGAAALSIVLKNMKSAEHSLTLDKEALSSSMFDLKQAYASKFAVPVDKIKLLYGKKPVADSKTLQEVLGEETISKGDGVEFSVMLMGGVAPGSAKQDEGGKPKAEVKAVDTEEFWKDLKAFLMQRTKDEKEAERLVKFFRGSVS